MMVESMAESADMDMSLKEVMDLLKYVLPGLRFSYPLLQVTDAFLRLLVQHRHPAFPFPLERLVNVPFAPISLLDISIIPQPRSILLPNSQLRDPKTSRQATRLRPNPLRVRLLVILRRW
jgi:hypothetical protein